MIYFGLDPGTSDNMALAALLPDDTIHVRLTDTNMNWDVRDRATLAAGNTRIAFKSLPIPDDERILALEWQRPLPTDKRPQNICDLSAFAGIALAALQSVALFKTIYTPLPETWKGSIKKWMMHNRIVARAGKERVVAALIAAKIPVPASLGDFAKEFTGKAGNALDAIGLAQWAKMRHRLLTTVESARLSR